MGLVEFLIGGIMLELIELLEKFQSYRLSKTRENEYCILVWFNWFKYEIYNGTLIEVIEKLKKGIC